MVLSDILPWKPCQFVVCWEVADMLSSVIFPPFAEKVPELVGITAVELLIGVISPPSGVEACAIPINIDNSRKAHRSVVSELIVFFIVIILLYFRVEGDFL